MATPKMSHVQGEPKYHLYFFYYYFTCEKERCDNNQE
jgi:hypothetical protein